jgi:hypothetical protein
MIAVECLSREERIATHHNDIAAKKRSEAYYKKKRAAHCCGLELRWSGPNSNWGSVGDLCAFLSRYRFEQMGDNWWGVYGLTPKESAFLMRHASYYMGRARKELGDG